MSSRHLVNSALRCISRSNSASYDDMNIDKFSLRIACTAFVLSTVVSAQTGPIDSYIQAEMAKRHIPGLALVVIKDNKIIKASNYVGDGLHRVARGI